MPHRDQHSQKIVVRLFAEDIRQTLGQASKPTKKWEPNLTKREQMAFRKLEHRKDIIINSADKGLGTVPHPITVQEGSLQTNTKWRQSIF